MTAPAKDDAAAALALFLDVMADLVAERCAARLGSIAPTEYTSSSPPPGMSRRTFNDRCKQLADRSDARVRKPGRQWVASREAIDEKPVRRRVPVTVVQGPWSPQAALEAAGVRAQRK
jgi:hypothetical protein